jgi:hypothetical protein
VLPPGPARQHLGEGCRDARRAVGGTVRAELRGTPPFERGGSSFVPPLRRGPHGEAVDPGQRVAPPEGEGAFDRRRVATRQQVVGLGGVQPVVVEAGAVADALDRLHDPRQPVAQLGDDLVDLLARRARWLAVPQRRDERVQRDGAAAGQQEPGQQRTRTRPGDDDLTPAVVDRERAQDAQLHGADGTRRCRRARAAHRVRAASQSESEVCHCPWHGASSVHRIVGAAGPSRTAMTADERVP